MALTEKYISADSHVVEPVDLWTKRVGGAGASGRRTLSKARIPTT